MAHEDLQRAIQLMQTGASEQAAAMLERLLQGGGLDAPGRAAAYVWLAETRPQKDFKVRCLQQALHYAPQMPQLQQQLNELQRESRPPVARVFGLFGSVNAPASAINLGFGGLFATTSFAVGAASELTLRTEGAGEVMARVVGRFPQDDLALLRSELAVDDKLPTAPSAIRLGQQTVVAHIYGSGTRHGSVMGSNAVPGHWFPVRFGRGQLVDAGGNPLYDSAGQCLGLLTRNKNSSGDWLALRMGQVHARARSWLDERQRKPEARLCGACGSLAQAPAYGGRACEHCGAVLVPGTESSPPAASRALLALRGEDRIPCPHCAARVGDYGGRCLRCGRSVAG